MREAKEGIGTIHYGEIHLYYPLQFITKKDFDYICTKIENSEIVYSAQYRDKVMEGLGAVFSERFSEVTVTLENDCRMKSKITIPKEFKRNQVILDEVDTNDVLVCTDVTQEKIAFSVKSQEVDFLQKRVDRLLAEKKTEDRIYGEYFKEYVERLLLLPIKVQLINGNEVFINLVLYVFSNKMAILKLELPVTDVDTNPLLSNDIFKYIKQIVKNHVGLSEENSFFDVICKYVKKLSEVIKMDIKVYDCGITHDILINYEGMPYDIIDIPAQTKIDLYKIVSAPVPEIPMYNYIEEAAKHLNTYHYSAPGVEYFIKTTGSILSTIDRRGLDYYTSNYQNENDKNYENISVNEFLVMRNSVNVEFAIMILLLKKVNHLKLYNSRLFKLERKSKREFGFYENVIFINQLQERCYASVIDQIKVLEEAMIHYFRKELMEEKIEAIRKLREEERVRRNLIHQNFFMIASCLATIIFGLPAIKETITLLNGVMFDICVENVINISIWVWGLMIGLVLIKTIENFRK